LTIEFLGFASILKSFFRLFVIQPTTFLSGCD
jgi:hypothetical protein